MQTLNKITFIIILSCINCSFAQTGIGTNAPNEHSVLELVSNNKGLLLPRLSLTSSTTFLNGSATASDNSLLVYNTNTSTSGTGLSGPGFYYWDSGATGKWIKINSGTGLVDANGDTQVQVEETTDDDTIRFDTAGTERMIIDPNGNVGIGIGTATPVTQLDITGDLRTDTFSTEWINNTNTGTYAMSDVIVYQGALYRNLSGTNRDMTPDVDVTNWRNLDTPFASVTNELLFDDRP